MTVKKKFNTKEYQGKARVYQRVAPNIQRLWVWDEARSEYREPQRGGLFEARRADLKVDGSVRRAKQSFTTLEEARQWQARLVESAVSEASIKPADSGPTLASVVESWRRRSCPRLAPGTRNKYEGMIERYFGPLLPMGVRAITPKVVDAWLDDLRDPDGPAMKVGNRMGFEHELTTLTLLLRFYEEYNDDEAYRCPIKARHRKMAKPVWKREKKRDLSEAEFLKFREHLLDQKYGKVMWAMATVQYYQMLRISEVAAIYKEDVSLNAGTIYIRRSVQWPRRKGDPTYVRTGFKNAEANGGLKESHLLDRNVIEALNVHQPEQGTQLVFSAPDGKPLEYRWIQHAYDRAFRQAGLNYTGTHVMRHGGARHLLALSGGDITLVQQGLGNADIRSTMVYAKRDKAALREFAKKRLTLVANGRKDEGAA